MWQPVCERMIMSSALMHKATPAPLPKCADFWAKIAAFHLRQADPIGRCNADIIQVCCAFVCCALLGSYNVTGIYDLALPC